MIRHALTASCLAVALACASAPAQEPQRIDGDKAKEAGKHLVDAIAKLELPIKVTPNAEGGTGLHANKAGAFVVPDKNLTADALKKHEKGALPVGVLFITDVVTLISGDKPVPSKEHLTAELTIKDQTVTVNVITLAAAKVEDRLVLLAYAKGKKPMVVAELDDSEDKSDYSLDVEARKQEDKRAVLILNVLGKHKAALRLAAKEE
jgi:hypothetical protein